MSSTVETIALICLIWSLVVVLVNSIGVRAVLQSFTKIPETGYSSTCADAPHVTIIRPIKGLEPHLYDCLASSFTQTYPTDKYSIRLCISDTDDPAHSLLQTLLADFPNHDAEILIEAQDDYVNASHGQAGVLGLNPKIRNISRAYREAKGDLVWIIDSNVWAASGVLGRMVDKLMSFAPGQQQKKPYTFVHHLPLAVDVSSYAQRAGPAKQSLLSSASEASPATDTQREVPQNTWLSRLLANGGGRLDEMFLATTHAKFYAAINTVGIAPCIVGKSNMFRKSHLDQVTNPKFNRTLPTTPQKPTGVDYFSYNICEDHLIGDILFKAKIPGHSAHGLVWGDLVLQPMEGMSIPAYIARRIRWLRARKFTVLAATLVEPGVESLLCCAYFAFAVTHLPWFHDRLGIPPTWAAGLAVWLACVSLWMLVDRKTFNRLHSGTTFTEDGNTPAFARAGFSSGEARSFAWWLLAWLGRETLALPIWTWAVLFGQTVHWRGKSFRVRMDTSVEQQPTGPQESGQQGTSTPELERATRHSSKHRVD